MITLTVLIIAFLYCEYIWQGLTTKPNSTKKYQSEMKFFIGLNLILSLFTQSFGNLLIVGILTFYYLVLIPYRISKLD